MLNGHYRGKTIGSGTDVWKLSEDVRAGVMSPQEFMEAESAMSRSAGYCMTMGTASTMAPLVEALRVALHERGMAGGGCAPCAARPHDGAPGGGDGRRGPSAFENIDEGDVRERHPHQRRDRGVDQCRGSLAGNRRSHCVDLTLDDWDRLGRDVPTIVDLMPSGRFLMEDFCYAGGIPVVMAEIADLLKLDALTVTGRSVGANIEGVANYGPEVIRSRNNPLVESGGIAVLRGNLAPDGAVLKPSAASPHLLSHRGPAVVFENIEDFHAHLCRKPTGYARKRDFWARR